MIEKKKITGIPAVMHFLPAVFFLGLAVFCGCGNREAAFLEETGKESVEQIEETAGGAMDPAQEEAAGDEGESPSETEVPARIFVDVCGAVAMPGVYELEEGSRVFQAVEAAGGYLPEAAENYLNRAKCLLDGQQIYVPTESELEDAKENGENPLFVPAPDSEPETAGNVQGADSASGNFSGEGMSARVNLNTADESQLTTLTGIGASKAKAIIAYREANGGFSSIEEIMNVEGIKEGTFSRIKDEIVVG